MTKKVLTTSFPQGASIADMTGELVVISGRYKGHRVPLLNDGLRIGRDRSCAVSVDDEAASRIHSEIVRREGQFVLRDLQSTNGTYLNDARVFESPLQNGDRIGVGETVLLLKLEKPKDMHSPQVVFSKDQKKLGTSFSVSLKDTRFLEISVGASADKQHQFSQLYEFMVDIAGILHPPALLERSLDHFFAALKADRGLILLLTPDGTPGLKATRVADGLPNQNITIAQTMAHQLLQKKESFLSVNSPAEPLEQLDKPGQLGQAKSINPGDPAASEFPAFSAHSNLGAPLKVKDKVIGLVYFETAAQDKEFAEQDLKLCAAMALQLAICIENTRLYTELLDAAEFNNSVLRSLGSGVMVLDQDGRVLRLNRATQDILGMSELSLVGHLLSEFPGLAELNKIVQTTLSSGRGEDRNQAMIQPGGGVKQTAQVPLGVSTSLLSDHTGKTIGVVANFRNLAPIRKLEEQVRRSQHMAALGQMAAGVAHEVRNPLNSIRGFTQLLQEMPGGNESTKGEYTQIILEEVDRMNHIVQDLLDFSRQRELTMHPVEVQKLLFELVRNMKQDADLAGAELKLIDSGNVFPNVFGDGGKIRQVFRNIILNALQACTKDGRVSVGMTLIASPVAGVKPSDSSSALTRREIAINVADNGSGIAPDVLAKIFDPFFTMKEKGTGLGLSISQKIVEQHGGRIEVKSDPGKGSTFTVVLPAI